MTKETRHSEGRSEKHMPRSSGTPLYRFVKMLGSLFGMTPDSDGAGVKAYEGEASASPRSVDRAARSSGKRAKKARKAKASASSNSRKPPARKIAHRAGAK